VILFKKIRWKNFLSTGNIFTEVDFTKSTTTLIVGENGAGKSTILDALSFVLYNKPFRNINKPQLVNAINKKDLLVEIEFDIGLQSYKIVRGIKPSIFEVYHNNKLLNQDSSVRDYQEVLEKQILKLNHKSFCQVVILGSASFVPFMQLSSMHRREVIEDLLDIQIFSIMNTLLKTKIQLLSTTITETSYNIDLVKEKITLNEDMIKTLRTNSDNAIKEKQSIITETESRIKLENDQVVELMVQVQDLQKQISDQQMVKGKQHKLEVLKGQIENKINKLEKDIEFFENHDNCPTCRQEIDNQFKCDTISSRKVQIDETKTGVEQLSQELTNINNRLNAINDINNEIISLNMRITVHNTNISALNEYIGKVNQEIQGLSKTHQNNAKDTNKLAALKSELNNLEESKIGYTNDMELYRVGAAILKDTGIKSKIIKQYVPIINKLINKYLAAMDFFVNFELDENFNETIKSRFRDEFSYASFSEGEKMRINLAILFTWRAIAKLRNSASTNLLIMDEIFDGSLDSTGTEEFMKILNQLTLDTNTFIISHKTDQLSDKFQNVLRFTKVKNFSQVMQ
jgi:DNA repair exonuclease SbcCD ATPase subunit